MDIKSNFGPGSSNTFPLPIVSNALIFIEQYRSLEKANLIVGFNLISECLAPDNKSLYNHLCSHWKSKKKAFGEFFLNLSSRNQIRILHHWNIIDEADEKYLLSDEYTDGAEYLFGESPKTREVLHYLLVFFLNHGISDRPDTGLELDEIPKKNLYGNSANWGEYILNHSCPTKILSIIIGHVEATKPQRKMID